MLLSCIYTCMTITLYIFSTHLFPSICHTCIVSWVSETYTSVTLPASPSDLFTPRIGKRAYRNSRATMIKCLFMTGLDIFGWNQIGWKRCHGGWNWTIYQGMWSLGIAPLCSDNTKASEAEGSKDFIAFHIGLTLEPAGQDAIIKDVLTSCAARKTGKGFFMVTGVIYFVILHFRHLWWTFHWSE